MGEVYSNCVLSVWRLQVVEMMCSNQELADMRFILGLATRRLYQERYPEVSIPPL
jgi:hypothetical protein